MTLVDGKSHGLAKALTIRLVGMDEHTHLRHLHTKSMENQSADSLTYTEIQAFIAFFGSSDYSDILK